MSTRPSNPSSHRCKRVRFATDSSSSPTTSDASTLAPADDSTAASDYDSESDTSISSSSEEPSSESSSEDEDSDVASDNDDDVTSQADLEEHTGRNGITSLRAGQGKKPTMKLDQDELGPDIRSFLKDFLPQLKAANEELEAQRKAGTLKGREIDAEEEGEVDGGSYIEMDLGLGVLEEKKEGVDSEDSASDVDEDMEDGEKEKDVLAKLMGRKGKDTKQKVVVQEVGDTQSS